MSELQRLFLTRGVEAAVQCSNVVDFECDLSVLFLSSLTASQSDKRDPYLPTYHPPKVPDLIRASGTCTGWYLRYPSSSALQLLHEPQ